MKNLVLVLTLLLSVAKPIRAGILWYEWELIRGGQSYPELTAYPIGWAVLNKQADAGLQVRVSKSVGLDVGIQTPSPYSCVGVYIGPSYLLSKEKLGISTRVNITALIFNAFASSEYVGSSILKFGIGIGIPYFWFIPNRESRK